MMIIAFTGAGISADSGIQTFQTNPAIRNKLTRQYARKHPEKYRKVMKDFVAALSDKEPNDAHRALAEYEIPVLTMNVDGLHQKAGTSVVVPLHGSLPTNEELEFCDKLYNKPVLYGDEAPNYQTAFAILDMLIPGDVFLVVGASTYTNISSQLRNYAKIRGAEVVEIQEDAAHRVREYLKSNEQHMETWENFKTRFPDPEWLKIGDFTEPLNTPYSF